MRDDARRESPEREGVRGAAQGFADRLGPAVLAASCERTHLPEDGLLEPLAALELGHQRPSVVDPARARTRGSTGADRLLAAGPGPHPAEPARDRPGAPQDACAPAVRHGPRE